MSLYKRGSIYWAKFMVKGEMHYASCETGNKREAEAIEAEMRSEINRGNFGILKPQRAMTLRVFFANHFLPFVQSSPVPSTRKYYGYGSELLLAHLGDTALDQITSEHVAGIVSRYKNLSKSSINCALRVLRRALRLAVDWKKLDRAPQVQLEKGERQRDRVVEDKDFLAYLNACAQPWRDIAMVIRGAGCRPGEVYALRWENVLLDPEDGRIQIIKGKTKAARRVLPMVPEVYATLKSRHDSQGCPEQGWVFPSTTGDGHVSQSLCNKLHRQALETSSVEAFEPYCLRHTALTALAEDGADPYALAKIAGHTSIVMTGRYVHPQRSAIDDAFKRTSDKRKLLGTNLGTVLEKA